MQSNPFSHSPPGSHPLRPWQWRSLPLQGRTGTAIFQALYIDPQQQMPRTAIATLLESPYPVPQQANTPTPRYSICAGAPRLFQNHSQVWTPTLGTHLSTLQTLLDRAQSTPPQPESVTTDLASTDLASTDSASTDSAAPPDHLPFHGGWLGWLGYDVAWEIETLPYQNPDPLPFPISFWYEPDTFVILDHQEQRLWLAATHPADLDRLQSRLSRPTPLPPSLSTLHPQSSTLNPPSFPPSLTFLTSQQEFQAAVQTAKAHIQAGDIFQTNLSLRFSSQTTATSWAIYQALQQVNPSPFSSYWHTPWGDIVSCSPERLVTVRDRMAETRPIAGTRPRGETPDADRGYEQDLTRNVKENAEHIMLVDLERNDLGRVCKWGSVQVNELLTIERYSHVMHLVSNVIGTVAPNKTSIDVVRALFPGGTITGCPKVRCMEIIEELEPVRRSLFYGSCGYVDIRGFLDLNILIRTLLCDRQNPEAGHPTTVWGQVGAGIVADSHPLHEWKESLSKAKAQLDALKLADQIGE